MICRIVSEFILVPKLEKMGIKLGEHRKGIPIWPECDVPEKAIAELNKLSDGGYLLYCPLKASAKVPKEINQEG